MDRRQFNSIPVPLVAALVLRAQQRAHALSIAELSNTEATHGLKVALEKGALAAVNLLGKTDGFLGNEKVRRNPVATGSAVLTKVFGALN